MIADFYRFIAFLHNLFAHFSRFANHGNSKLFLHFLSITEIRKLADDARLSKIKKFFTKKLEIYFQSQTVNSAAYFRLAHHSRDYHNVLTNAHSCVVY